MFSLKFSKIVIIAFCFFNIAFSSLTKSDDSDEITLGDSSSQSYESSLEVSNILTPSELKSNLIKHKTKEQKMLESY